MRTLADGLRLVFCAGVTYPEHRPVTVSAGPAVDALVDQLQAARRDLRQAELCLSAVTCPSVPPWSPVKAWHRCRRLPMERRVRRLSRLVTDLRRRTGRTEQRFWRPRPAAPCDRRIASRYDPEATFSAWPE